MCKITHSRREWQRPGKLIETGKQSFWKLWQKDVQPAMPCLTFLSKRETLFMPRKKHTHCVSRCITRHSIDPDCQVACMNHHQLKIALQARAKLSPWWI